MTSTIKIEQPLVSVDWLFNNFDHPKLIILDATIPKVSDANNNSQLKRIPKSRFFDIKNAFSDLTSPLPNTFPSITHFEIETRKLGIHNDSIIVVYDNHGIYSSPRAWWMLKSCGHKNVAVLDGGLPAWIEADYPLEESKPCKSLEGNFKVNFHPEMIVNSQVVFNAISNDITSIIDARSNNRFNAIEPEPRKEIRSGHIPNSVNLPYTELLENGKFLNKDVLKDKFATKYQNQKELIFSCGSGITACILALGAEISEVENIAVYDGSWTDWGSNYELPIEK